MDPAVAPEQQVCRFDVTVDKARFMRCGQTPCGLKSNKASLGDADRPLGVQHAAEGAAAEQLRDDVRPTVNTVGVSVPIQDGQNVRVAELRSEVGLTPEEFGETIILDQI